MFNYGCFSVLSRFVQSTKMIFCHFQMPLSLLRKVRSITLTTATSLTPGQLRTIPGRGTRHFTFPKRPDRYWNSSNFLLRWHRWFSLWGQRGWGVKLSTYLYLEPILKTSGIMSPPNYSVACTGTALISPSPPYSFYRRVYKITKSDN
jgi:hypothetical protein